MIKDIGRRVAWLLVNSLKVFIFIILCFVVAELLPDEKGPDHSKNVVHYNPKDKVEHNRITILVDIENKKCRIKDQ